MQRTINQSSSISANKLESRYGSSPMVKTSGAFSTRKLRMDVGTNLRSESVAFLSQDFNDSPVGWIRSKFSSSGEMRLRRTKSKTEAAFSKAPKVPCIKEVED